MTGPVKLTAWLAAVKEGDQVAERVQGGARIVTVTSTTRTLLRVGTVEYDRTTGARRGWHDSFRAAPRLRPVTQDVIDYDAEREKIVDRLRSVAWGKLPLDRLRRLRDVLDEP